jgi:hypothetical protein
MRKGNQEPSLKVQAIGEAALNWLTSGRSGVVVAAVNQAIYLGTAEDELYWITGEDSPMHRRCLQISSPMPKVAVGARVDVRNRRLEITSRDSLDWSLARVWKSPALLAGDFLAPEKLVERSAFFICRFLEQAQPAGLGKLLPVIFNHGQHPAGTGFDQSDIFLTSAWPPVEQILALLSRHEYCSFPEAASDLVGLGEGLTPSGDDFLGGLLFCLNRLRQAYPRELDIAGDYSSFIEQSKTRTNRISYALLKDNARGHGLEPLENFASALLGGDPDDSLQLIAELLINVGHSTGWDMLTGFLVGLTATSPIGPLDSPK